MIYRFKAVTIKKNVVFAILVLPLQILAMESEISQALNAIADQDITTCKVLLEHGLDPNSPVVIKRYANNPSDNSFASMLRFNCDSNYEILDNQERYITPLCSFRATSNLLRVSNQQRHNKETSTLLHQAVQCPQIIELLLGAGAQVDATNSFKQTALEHAVMDLEPASVELLLKQGANPKRKLVGGGSLLQHATLIIKLAQETSRISHKETLDRVCAIIRLLKPTVLEIVKRDILEATALHHVAKEYEVLCCLLVPHEQQPLHPELVLATAKKIYSPEERTMMCDMLMHSDSSGKRPLDYAKDVSTRVVLNPLHWQAKNAE